MKYHSSQRNPIIFRVPYHSSSIHILCCVSLALLEQGNDGWMAVLSVCPSLLPNCLQGTILDPAHLDCSGLAVSWVRVHFNPWQVICDGLLEAVCRTTISSRATVLNINLVGHIKLLISTHPAYGLYWTKSIRIN